MSRRVLYKMAAAVAVAGSLALGTVTTASAAGLAPPTPAGAAADAASRGGGGGSGGVSPNSGLDPKIRVDESANKIVATLRGVGKQVYDCDGTGYKLREPVATLEDLRSKKIGGIHGAGPFWASFDGSRVIGNTDIANNNPITGFGSIDPPIGNPPGVKWLRIPAKEKFGTGGVFSNITFIQRTDTRGGLAPAAPCRSTVAVDYSTIYVFWVARR